MLTTTSLLRNTMEYLLNTMDFMLKHDIAHTKTDGMLTNNDEFNIKRSLLQRTRWAVSPIYVAPSPYPHSRRQVRFLLFFFH